MCEFCGMLGLDPGNSKAGASPPELDLPGDLEPRLIDDDWMITIDEAKRVVAQELRRIALIGRANASIPGSDIYPVMLRTAAEGFASGLEFRANQLAPKSDA